MKAKKSIACALAAILLLCAGTAGALASGETQPSYEDAVLLTFDGSDVLVDGAAAPADDPSAAVYTGRDIVYYEDGHDFTYGEGSQQDAHTPEQAAAHTVVHITQPGAYRLQGVLDQGQVAVDLGEDAKSDPGAAVTLILDGVDITCTVAPAVIFYNVYECDPDGSQGFAPDLSAAGAAVVIADGSENNISGSYVARIYKSYTLNAEGAAVTDSKKLHKYDGAFYSKMSMRVDGGSEGTGVLNITAENEGLDTEMHLTVNGGNINIRSGNDGINCNEDGLSVVTIDGGDVHITVTGQTGEGDGIDSNGWLVINSGTVIAQACSASADAGLDAENAIYLNGGLVVAAGSMLDSITPSDQCGALFSFARRQSGGVPYTLTGPDGEELMVFTPENDFTFLLMTSPALTEGENYSLYAGETQLAVAAGGSAGMGGLIPGGFGGRDQEGQTPSELPQGQEGQTPPEPPQEQDGQTPPEPPQEQDGQTPPEPPQEQEGQTPPELPHGQDAAGQADVLFSLAAGINSFTVPAA